MHKRSKTNKNIFNRVIREMEPNLAIDSMRIIPKGNPV